MCAFVCCLKPPTLCPLQPPPQPAESGRESVVPSSHLTHFQCPGTTCKTMRRSIHICVAMVIYMLVDNSAVCHTHSPLTVHLYVFDISCYLLHSFPSPPNLPHLPFLLSPSFPSSPLSQSPSPSPSISPPPSPPSGLPWQSEYHEQPVHVHVHLSYRPEDSTAQESSRDKVFWSSRQEGLSCNVGRLLCLREQEQQSSHNLFRTTLIFDVIECMHVRSLFLCS